MVGGLLVAGCSGSDFLIQQFYGRLDGIILKRFDTYVRFDDEQQAWVETSLGDFMRWHRREQLPHYADFLLGLRQRIAVNSPPQRQDVEWMMVTLQDFFDRSFAHFPFTSSANVLRGLSGRQVEQIATGVEREYQRLKGKLDRLTAKQRQLHRARLTRRVLAIFGIRTTKTQDKIILNAIERRAGDQYDDLKAWHRWAEQFVDILHSRRIAGFESRVQHHISDYASLHEVHKPDNWRYNFELTGDMFFDVFVDLNETQRAAFAERLAELAALMRRMADDT